MAMACLGSVTFLLLRPLFSFPCFIAFISASTFLDALGEYLREELVFWGALVRTPAFPFADFVAVFFVAMELPPTQ